MHVFIIADVRIIRFHLPFDHRLLPSAAGHRQADEEGLPTTTLIKGETLHLCVCNNSLPSDSQLKPFTDICSCELISKNGTLEENVMCAFSRHPWSRVQPWTHRNKSPVTKVIDGAEEPEFVEEKIGSSHSALV